MKITKHLWIPVVTLFFAAITVFVACNKNATKEQSKVKAQNATLQRSITLGSIPLYYKDEKGTLISLTFDNLQSVYGRYAILPVGSNTLLSSERVDGVDDDGNAIIGVKTKWQHYDEEKYTSITSRMFKSTDGDGNDIYIIGDSETMGSTSTCSCTGFCTSGCDASMGPSFCACTPCFPGSAACEKKHTIVLTSEFSL